MAEIRWFPTGPTADGSGFHWTGHVLSKQTYHAYTRVFTSKRYTQIKRTLRERTTPHNAADLLREMREKLPPEEGTDVLYHGTIL